MINRFVISRIKSSSSDTTDGGSDDLPSEDANTPSMNSQKRKREKTRKYSEYDLKFAFTYKETDGEELAVCVVCSSVLSNETMKPSKLQRHSKTTHPHLKEKKKHISRLKSFEGQQTISHSWRASFKTLLSSCITCRSDQNAIHEIGSASC